MLVSNFNVKVNSKMKKRNVLNSPRLLELKKKRHRVFLSKILLFLFVFVIIFISLVYLSRISALNINAIEITGNKAVDTEMIKVSVEKEITGNYLWFFPKTNILFYPQNSIKNKLLNEFKRLQDIKFSIKDRKILEVSVSERIASYTWCGDTFPENENSNQKCHFMDEDGYVFDEAPYFSGEVYFRFYGSISTETYFSKENFKQLINFKDSLIAMGFKPVSMYILDNGNVKVFLSNLDKTQIRPYLAFKVSSDFKNITENLEAALSTEPLKSNLKDKYSSLEYIDLRFGNKVYYKFR